MGTSTFSNLRVGKKGSSAGVPKLMAEITFDPSVPPAGTGFVLPVGSVIIGGSAIGNSTGGTAPTMDIGLEGAADSLLAEGDSDIGTAVALSGAAIQAAALAADTEIWAGEGAETSATGGTATIYLEYYIQDPRSGENN